MAWLLWWWLMKPNSEVPGDDWNTFLEKFSMEFAAIILVVFLLTLVFYYISARQRRIYSLDDVFAGYRPMLWILLGVLAGITTCVLFLEQFPATPGNVQVALELLFVSTLITSLLSYLTIILVSPLTPNKYRYRPAPYLHKSK